MVLRHLRRRRGSALLGRRPCPRERRGEFGGPGWRMVPAQAPRAESEGWMMSKRHKVFRATRAQGRNPLFPGEELRTGDGRSRLRDPLLSRYGRGQG